VRSRAVTNENIVVGARFGSLTIVSTSPMVQRCDCGETCKWKRIDIVKNGVRSCGCRGRGTAARRLSPNPKWEPGVTFGTYRIIEKADGYRKWLVKCVRCGTEAVRGEPNLYARNRRCGTCGGPTVKDPK